MAPAWNPRAELITGTVCGVRVENIEDPQEKKMRQLDKLVDELAQGKPMEKVLRCFFFQQSKVHRFSVVPGIEVQNYTKPMLFELQQ